MLAIEIKNLTKDYKVGFWKNKSRRALDGLTLNVEAGETFGLLGPNGAGKSTTLKILFRLIFPSAGAARILGRDIQDLSVRARLGFLPENPNFYDHLTAEEFMMFAAGLLSIPVTEARRRTGQLLDRAGLAGSRGLRIRKFSKGMVQRLGIAQALINNPDLIFLDEPMSGLDPMGRREVRNLILELRKEGKTIFFSTHILSDAETLCDRVAILDRGRLLGCGELEQMLAMNVRTVEVVLERPSAQALEELKPYARAMVRTGDRVRIESDEKDAELLLGTALACGARVHSFNPVKSSLEDYFMAQVSTPSAPEDHDRRLGSQAPDEVRRDRGLFPQEQNPRPIQKTN